MPRVLLMTPPVYDFALFDQFYKPFALMRLLSWFEGGGWEAEYVNALSFCDERSTLRLGAPKRNDFGQGHFYREVLSRGAAPVDLPPEVFSGPRRFARYGIVPESLTEQMQGAFGGTEPDLVLIASGMTYWYKGVQEAVALCRKLYPGAVVVVGGIYATLMEPHCLEKCRPDGVFSRHSAADLNALLLRLQPKWGLPEKGRVPFLPIPGEIPLLPSLLPAAWGTACVVRLNKGCRMNCAYCASRAVSNGFESGNWQAWFWWLQRQYTENGIRNVAFYDDALLCRFERVLKPFLTAVIQSGMKIRFYCPNALHIQLITEENAALMRAAGFAEIRLGYESNADTFHSAYDRKYQPSDFERALRWLHQTGFSESEIRCYILAGLPFQRKEAVEQAVVSAAAAGAQPVIAEFTPIPGSPLWPQCVKSSPLDIAGEPLFQNNTFFPMAWEGFTPKDMEGVKQKARTILKG